MNRKKRLGRWTQEDREQAALVEWFDYKYSGKLLMSNPLGDYRPPVVRMRLNLTGARAGTPDLFLAEPVGPWHGMYIEMKSRIASGKNKGKKQYPSKEQRELLYKLRRRQYAVVVCWSADEAMEEIKRYLSDAAPTDKYAPVE